MEMETFPAWVEAHSWNLWQATLKSLAQVPAGREGREGGLQQLQLQQVHGPLPGLPHRPGSFQQDGPFDLKYKQGSSATISFGSITRLVVIVATSVTIEPEDDYDNHCKNHKDCRKTAAEKAGLSPESFNESIFWCFHIYDIFGKYWQTILFLFYFYWICVLIPVLSFLDSMYYLLAAT